MSEDLDLGRIQEEIIGGKKGKASLTHIGATYKY